MNSIRNHPGGIVYSTLIYNETNPAHRLFFVCAPGFIYSEMLQAMDLTRQIRLD